jgi:hypothetical protein
MRGFDEPPQLHIIPALGIPADLAFPSLAILADSLALFHRVSVPSLRSAR